MLSPPKPWRPVAGWRLLGAVLGVLLCVPAAPALARSVYVVNAGSNDVSVIDTATNQTVGTPIPVGASPFVDAITPDGARVYVTSNGSNSVSVIATATNQVVGAPIPVGAGPIGVAIAPNGGRAYVADAGSNDVSVIDTATNQTVGAPIPVGSAPILPAITPNGARAYVTNQGSDDVSVIDTATNQVLGAPIPAGSGPAGIAITPDGGRAYVADAGSASVSVIDTATNQVIGTPIPVGSNPGLVAITPNGSRAYVINQGSADVSVIDTATNQTVGTPIPIGGLSIGVGITPDGTRAYVSSNSSGEVSVIDTATNQVVGAPIPVGAGPAGISIVPDQPPKASFPKPAALIGAKVKFTAAKSSDPDGQIARYAWDFGDGKSTQSASPKVSHTFKKRGHFQVKLTLTDNEGCSASLIFTGQTALCNGSAVAALTRTVKVGFPRIRLKCPEQAQGKCTVSARAVSKRKHGKLESRVARAKVKPGKSKLVTLRTKKAFRSKLGLGKHVLTRQRVRVHDKEHTRYQRLRLKRP